MLASFVFALVAIAMHFLFVFALPAVSPEIQGVISIVVAGAAGLLVHFGLESRAASVVGILMAGIGIVGSDQVSGFIPPRFAVPCAIVGAVLLAMNERLQGGVSDPAKRREAVNKE